LELRKAIKIERLVEGVMTRLVRLLEVHFRVS